MVYVNVAVIGVYRAVELVEDVIGETVKAGIADAVVFKQEFPLKDKVSMFALYTIILPNVVSVRKPPIDYARNNEFTFTATIILLSIILIYNIWFLPVIGI